MSSQGKTQKLFFFSKSRKYLVIGASSNPSKFGYKVLEWYIDHSLDVIPINPNPDIKQICGIETFTDIKESWNYISNQFFDGISISFITPPIVTKSILNSLKEPKNEQFVKNLKGLWFQPGSFDEEVIQIAEELGIIERFLSFGDCILIQGEKLLENSFEETTKDSKF